MSSRTKKNSKYSLRAIVIQPKKIKNNASKKPKHRINDVSDSYKNLKHPLQKKTLKYIDSEDGIFTSDEIDIDTYNDPKIRNHRNTYKYMDSEDDFFKRHHRCPNHFESDSDLNHHHCSNHLDSGVNHHHCPNHLDSGLNHHHCLYHKDSSSEECHSDDHDLSSTTIALCTIKIESISTDYKSILVFPWFVREYHEFHFGKIFFEAEIFDILLDVQLYDCTYGQILGGLIVNSSGFYNFKFNLPKKNSRLIIQVKNGNIGINNPHIYGIFLMLK